MGRKQTFPNRESRFNRPRKLPRNIYPDSRRRHDATWHTPGILTRRKFVGAREVSLKIDRRRFLLPSVDCPRRNSNDVPNHFWLISRPRILGVECSYREVQYWLPSEVNIQRRRMSARTKLPMELLKSVRRSDRHSTMFV